MVELTIEITNNCPFNCDFCSSNALPDGVHLDFDTIKTFIDSYPEVDRINISGGEPLSHPEFYKILKYCKQKCDTVWVYTNEIENIAYNTAVLKNINVMANVPIVPGIDVHIPHGSLEVHLLKFIPQGRGESIQDIDVFISGNLTDGCDSCNNPTLLSNGSVSKCPCNKYEKTHI